MTLVVMAGVALASQPLRARKTSFGSHRADIITEALRSTAAAANRERFKSRARRELARQGVDLEQPHRNLPVDRLPPQLRPYAIDPLAELSAWLADRWGKDLARYAPGWPSCPTCLGRGSSPSGVAG